MHASMEVIIFHQLHASDGSFPGLGMTMTLFCHHRPGEIKEIKELARIGVMLVHTNISLVIPSKPVEDDNSVL
jgi:hypothetical protein